MSYNRETQHLYTHTCIHTLVRKLDSKLFRNKTIDLFFLPAALQYPAMRGQKPDPAKLEKLQEALGWLNKFLMEYTFAAGNKVTIADHCLVSTVSTIESLGIELDEYTRIVKWLKRCKTVMQGYKEANGDGAEMMGNFLKQKFEELKVDVNP